MYRNSFLSNILDAQRLLRTVEGDEGGGGGAAGADDQPKATPKTVTPPKDDDVKFDAKQQTAVDAIVKTQVKTAIDAAKAEWEASQKKAEDEKKGEFQKLYTELQPKYEELEKEAVALRKVVDTEIEAKAKLLPEGLTALMPSGDDRIAKLDWLQKAGTFKGDLGAPPPEPPTPDKKTQQEEFKSAVAARKNTGLYS